jgi:hypothetical protein
MGDAGDLDRGKLGPGAAGDDKRVQALVAAAADPKAWRAPDNPLQLGGKLRWRPHLVRPANAQHPGLLQVVLTDVLQPYFVERLRAAQLAGWDLHLVVDVGSLYASDFVAQLTGLDITIHVTREDGQLSPGQDLLTVLGVRAVALPRETVTKLAKSAWDRRGGGNAVARGRRLEGLLALLFGQVNGLRILETNLRTATEEIDIALQTDRNVDASWYESGVPFVLVESKNWTSTVGSKEISAFLVKVEYKRGRCRIGIMCAAGGFSPEARAQGLRLSATPLTIAMMGPKEIADWIDSRDPTQWLDRFVGREMLQ